VLLILTDGAISDQKETIDEIVRGSAHNMSIIIVGLGDYHFREMGDLDGDVKPLYSTTLKRYMSRDVV
jgi:hypothetical protein